MELHRLRELIDLARIYVQIGFTELDALIKAERELMNESFTVTNDI